jgi:glycosyltransferase involved in cell wall biosynthesis
MAASLSLALPPVERVQLPKTPDALAPVGDRGLNVIGFVSHPTGIGEDARTVSRAIGQHRVPIAPIDYAACERPTKLYVPPEPVAPYRVNLFCMPGDRMLPAYLYYGPRLFDGRYGIGYWPWELPNWPDGLMSSFSFVDEVWASTQYARNALASRSPVPVLHMPLPVVVERGRAWKRADFGLPEERFLFLFFFDLNSYIARKNPFACLEAFRKAFPRGDEKVGLVIKSMHVAPGHPGYPHWKRLEAIAAEDPRITILARTLTREEIVGLNEVCDCFVSLHRAEGFGRGPAEAMLLGKPAIVTNFSGNTDYAREDNACPVNYTLVDVKPGEYIFHEGQQWADADPEHAAWHMKRLFEDPGLAARLGDAGRKTIEEQYSLEAVSRRYLARLDELGLL